MARIKARDIPAGATYYTVCSPTGVVVWRTLDPVEAYTMQARNPDRLDVVIHVK